MSGNFHRRVGLAVVILFSAHAQVAFGAEVDAALDGAVGPDGVTIDPTTTEQYNTPRVWHATVPSPGAPTQAYRCRIVSYADKWTRHGVGNYYNFRFADRRGWKTSRPRPKPEPWPRRFTQDRDVDGDGDTSDDSVVSIDFSLDEVFHEHNWPHSVLFPERHNGRFYGGTAVLRSNTTKLKGAIREMGVNPDHSPPWWDGRAEDHPLNGGPDSSIGGNFHQHYWCVLWKKQDFINGGDRWRVTFDDSSVLAVIFTRTYWQGYDDVRLVAMDGDQLYISDNNGFDIPGPDNGPGMPGKTYGRGRVFRVSPTKVTWAKYNPHGNVIDFDAGKAKFAPHEFRNVAAVGWYLAKNNNLPVESHVKWYGFEADAVVHRPVQGSVHIDMAKVPATAQTPAFYMARHETPYELYRKIHRWGDAPFHTLQARYAYRKFGDIGSMQRPVEGAWYSQQEPVTNMTWYDLLAFCNTLSEYEGKTPCYYEDPEHKTIFRNMHIATRIKPLAEGEKRSPYDQPVFETVPEPKIYVKWDADGHRLPTLAEWQAAAEADVAPAPADKTQPVGTGKANANGIHDLTGNVWEPVWTFGDVYDTDAPNRHVVMGGDFQSADPTAATSAASDYGDTPWDGNFNIGLRLVCREKGLDKPAMGTAPKNVGYTNDPIPMWVFERNTHTTALKKPNEKPDGQLLDMVKIPAGSFVRYPDKNEISVHPFEMDKFEVTYEQWIKVLHWAEANGYEFSHDGDMGSMYWYSFPHTPAEPVTHITWFDLLVWCNALSEMIGETPCYYLDEERTQVYRKALVYRALKISGEEITDNRTVHPWLEKYGHAGNIWRTYPWIFTRWDTHGYRLPTPAEWEYAARGGTSSPYFWSEDRSAGPERGEYGWNRENSGGRTHPVGQKKPNPFGLYDIHGNVTEWLGGSIAGSDKRRPLDRDLNNPKGDPFWPYRYDETGYNPRGNKIPVCGGSWLSGDINLNGQHGLMVEPQNTIKPEFYYPDVGFRVARCDAGTHPRDGLEKMKEDVIVVQIPPEKLKGLDPMQDKVYRGNLARTGVFQTTGVAKLKGAKWTFAAGAPVRSSPVVVDGVVYVGSGLTEAGKDDKTRRTIDGALHAIDATTGGELWKFPIKGGVESTVAVADGKVFFPGNDERFYALDTETGEKLWTARGRVKAPKTCPTVAYDLVFCWLNDETVGLDVHTGKVAWTAVKAKPGTARCAAAVVGDRIHYYGGGEWGSLHVLDLSTGRRVAIAGGSRYGSAKCLYNTPAVVGQTTYFIHMSGLSAADLADGELRLRFYTKLDPLAAPNTDRINASPAVWNGVAVVPMDNGAVHGLEALQTGKVLWTFETGKANRSSPAIAAGSGLVYFGSRDGKLYALDVKTGDKAWEFATGGPVDSSPWPADGVIYVGSDDGHLYALE